MADQTDYDFTDDIIGEPMLEKPELKPHVVAIKKFYHQSPDQDADLVEKTWFHFCGEGDVYQRKFICTTEEQDLDKDGKGWVEKVGYILVVNIGTTDLQIGNWLIKPKTMFDGQPAGEEIKIKSIGEDGRYQLTLIPE